MIKVINVHSSVGPDLILQCLQTNPSYTNLFIAFFIAQYTVFLLILVVQVSA